MAIGFIPILSVTNMKTVSATSSIGGMIASLGYPFGTNTFGYLGFGGF